MAHNMRTGRGTYTWPDGRRHEGEYRDDKMNGYGTFTWPDGKRYEGEYRDDKQDGYGTLTQPGGGRWEGQWRNGCYGTRGGHRAWIGTTATACGFE